MGLNIVQFDENIFERMMNTANTALKDAECEQYTQAIVLLSTAGNEYSAVIKNALSEEKADEKVLLELLKKAEDTEIRYCLCMWQDGSVDIPSFAFRNMLCELNQKNSETLLFVMTAGGIDLKELFATMK